MNSFSLRNKEIGSVDISVWILSYFLDPKDIISSIIGEGHCFFFFGDLVKAIAKNG
jgi:hypothetical protein